MVNEGREACKQFQGGVDKIRAKSAEALIFYFPWRSGSNMNVLKIGKEEKFWYLCMIAIVLNKIKWSEYIFALPI